MSTRVAATISPTYFTITNNADSEVKGERLGGREGFARDFLRRMLERLTFSLL
jgi:hypothetical protein